MLGYSGPPGRRHHPGENALSAGPLQWMAEEGCIGQGAGEGLSTSPNQLKKASGVRQEGQDQTAKVTRRWQHKEETTA